MFNKGGKCCLYFYISYVFIGCICIDNYDSKRVNVN